MGEQERFTSFVHPLIAISIPLSFLFTQISLLSRWIPSWPLPPLAALMLSGVVGIITVLLGNILREERLGFSARLRELMILAIILYLASSLAMLFTGSGTVPGITGSAPGIGDGIQPEGAVINQNPPFLGFLRPSFFNIVVTSLGLLQWVFSVLIQGALRDRELLLAELETAQGLELQYRLRDMGTLAEDTLRGLRKIKLISRILLLIILIEATVHGVLFPDQGLLSQFFIVPLFLLYPFIAGLLSRYMREQYDAGAGIPPDSDSRQHQVRSLLAVLFLVFCLAILGAGTSSLLPIQWILAFFTWLSSLFPRQAPFTPPVPEPPPEGMDMEQLRRDLEDLSRTGEGSPDLTILWITLGMFAAVVAGLFLLFFLLSPLKSRYFWQKVGQLLSPKHIWENLKKMFSYLKPRRAKQIDGLDLDPDNIKQVKDQLARLTAAKEDRRKRAQLGKMAEAYLRFLRWGEGVKHPCIPSLAPGEYAALLTPHFPELTEPIQRIALIFEEALYGNTLLTRDKWNLFFSSIDQVVRYTEPEK